MLPFFLTLISPAIEFDSRTLITVHPWLASPLTDTYTTYSTQSNEYTPPFVSRCQTQSTYKRFPLLVLCTYITFPFFLCFSNRWVEPFSCGAANPTVWIFIAFGSFTLNTPPPLSPSWSVEAPRAVGTPTGENQMEWLSIWRKEVEEIEKFNFFLLLSNVFLRSRHYRVGANVSST